MNSFVIFAFVVKMLPNLFTTESTEI